MKKNLRSFEEVRKTAGIPLCCLESSLSEAMLRLPDSGPEGHHILYKWTTIYSGGSSIQVLAFASHRMEIVLREALNNHVLQGIQGIPSPLGLSPDPPAMLLQAAEGSVTLHKALESPPSELTPAILLQVSWKICDILTLIHGRGFALCNLNSHNVLVKIPEDGGDPDISIFNSIYLTRIGKDFAFDRLITVNPEFDPELSSRGPVRASCDLYSFGVIFSSILNKCRRCKGVEGEDGLRELEKRCLHQRPEERPTSLQMSQVLKNCLSILSSLK